MKRRKIAYSEKDVTKMQNRLASSTCSVKALSLEFFKDPSFCKHTQRSIEQKLLRLKKDLNLPDRIKRKKVGTFTFYSQDEVDEIIHSLTTSNEQISVLAKAFAIKHNRREQGARTKFHNIAKNVIRPEKVNVKKSYYVKKEKVQKPAIITVEKVEPSPQVIGIDIPEGTSFDIQNVKRVVLQKDCFTVYF
jgi:hypothetical protein